ncbi:MAG: hypothetical protein NTX22_01735 [Ignavibacteriales bacterium]|nr:hypothetical protein [Ignavibacteriales bacterium]
MKRIIVIIAGIIVIAANTIFSQVYGKIYSGNEADKIYGPVLNSVAINTIELQSYMSRTNKYLLFNIIDNKLILLDNKRISIYPENKTISNDVIFKVVSLSVLEELLNKGNSTTTYIEKRQDVLSITNGNYTLEYVGNCPPICF